MSRLYIFKPQKDKKLYPICLILHSAGITPNMITMTGFLVSVMAGVVAASGNIFTAIIIFMISAGLDAVDGSLARMSGLTTEFGRYLDSISDRLSETAFISGAVIGGISSTAYMVVVGSVLLLATRIFTHRKGFNSDTAIFGRPERLVLLVAGLLSPFPGNVILFGTNALLCMVSSLQILFGPKTKKHHEKTIVGKIL